MSDQRPNDPISAALDRAKQLDERPWNLFFLDAEAAGLYLPGGEPISSMALVELSPHELRQVATIASSNPAALAETEFSSALRCINCDADGNGGRQLTMADGSVEKVVSRMHPRVLEFGFNAYNLLHTNPVDKVRSFLKTRKVLVRR